MFITLPLLALLLLLLILRTRDTLWRSALLSAAVVWGLLLLVMTETLSLSHALTADALIYGWLAADMILLAMLWRHAASHPQTHRRPRPRLTPVQWCGVLGVGLIMAATATIALLSPPNNWDAMTFHLSRVMQWIQNQSVSHYPTHMLTQLQRAPLADFVVLHFHLLSHGDRFANLVQWLSMVGSVLGISLIARQLGGNMRAQILTAVLASTLPMGVMEASSTQVDYVVTFWLVCFVSIILRLTQSGLTDGIRFQAVLAGASLGLAILTKATAYLFGFPFFVWLAASMVNTRGRRAWPALGLIAVLVLAINSGLYVRNSLVLGTPLGFEQEDCDDPRCRHPLDAISFPIFASNIVRNIGLHASTPIESVNQTFQSTVSRIHDILGLDVNDPRTTWPAEPFLIPVPAYNEDRDGNTLHLLVMALATAGMVLWSRFKPSSDMAAYLFALLGGFAIFCLYLKWSPWGSRLHLSLFVLWAAPVGVTLSRLSYEKLVNGLMMMLLLAVIPWMLFNQNHPLVGRHTVFNTDRTSLYFAKRPLLKGVYGKIGEHLRKSGCTSIGLERGLGDWEYPLWVVLQDKGQTDMIHIRHVSVTNQSAMLSGTPPSKDFSPCATVTLHGERALVTPQPPRLFPRDGG